MKTMATRKRCKLSRTSPDFENVIKRLLCVRTFHTRIGGDLTPGIINRGRPVNAEQMGPQILAAFSRVFYKWNHTMYILPFACLLSLRMTILRFTHIVTCLFHCMTMPQFVCSSVVGRLRCFQFGALTNKAAVHIRGSVFAGHELSFLLDRYVRVEWLGDRVRICLTF
uniref:AP20 region protein 1 n=1 Tax=Felis catus TaxID=9685 RepID=A0ABI7WSG3_FELCA